ncbi:MAG: phosphoenolpyruvate--protein phosphotransferase [Chitinophagaceae bacterium]|nr:phosphoenolpyruvate--protein phosphotransferase [Oligoflexus sp.]
MLALDESLVRLDLKAKGKDDAIRQVASMLSESNCVDPLYEQSMLSREKLTETGTYLGGGIAIPHGLRDDSYLIRRTAIAVGQFPNGVVWGSDMVFLVIGIAAKTDEHIQVLANLAGVLQDETVSNRLAQTKRIADIVAMLTSDKPPERESTSYTADFKHAVDVTIAGAAGLHARPATTFAGIARQFEADIKVRFAGKTANGKAMASLLTLGVERGRVIRILARGKDAEQAILRLEAAVVSGLGEIPGPNDEAPVARTRTALRFAGDLRKGVGASPGIAMGEAFVLEKMTIHIEEKAGRYQDERNKLLSALMAARQELQKLIAEVTVQAGRKKAEIFLAHQDIIDDTDLLEETNRELQAGLSAALAFKKVTERRAVQLSVLKNELIAERADDVRDVANRVLRLLSGAGPTALMKRLPTFPVILITEDLSPSDAASLDPKRVIGLVTASGGPNSHTAILARSLGLPSVVGVGREILTVRGLLIIDGEGGVVVVAPSDADRALALRAMSEMAFEAANAKRDAYRPAMTQDGKRFETVANVGSVEDVVAAVEAGAEGIGLLRTEFFFLKRNAAPTEDEQYEILLRMAKALRGLPLVVRTLDIGGDKDVPYLQLPHEDNPFLGLRGIRLCLAHPELFEPQLRAIVRVAAQVPPGSIRVMFPMIATVSEFKDAKAALEKFRLAFNAPSIECGIMVEVPSAAMMADAFAESVDFFSIGMNDLTQYVLAMDRLHPSLAGKADGLHPAVLRLIKIVVDAAHAKGRWVSICGNLAADRIACPILVGLGVDELSVSPAAVAALKARIRNVTNKEAQVLAKRALACESAEEVRQLL